MATTLRDPWLATSSVTPDDLASLEASGMGSLRRGYESARLGTEANYNLAREASLRADGDAATADALQLQTQALQRRAGIYAPPVQRVEDINGIGDGASWLAGQIGSGAASMQDPALAAGALTAVGTGLSLVPHPLAQGAGFGLRNVAAPLAAFGINQQQLKGEHYGTLSSDQDVMAKFSPQELNTQANLYGGGAALLDTVMPALVGRQLGGAALLRKGAAPAMPAGLRTGGGLLMEGATETGQQLGSQMLHGQLNPERDASGDRSDLLNAFAGGVAGSIGPVAVGQVTDRGFQALGGLAGKAQDAAKGVVDLAKGALPGGSEGAIDLKASLKEASADKGPLADEDAAFMFGMPKDVDSNDAQAFGDWHRQNFQGRVDRVNGELQELAAAGDERAAELAAGFQTPDPMAQEDAIQAGAAHIQQRRGLQELADEAERSLAARGGAIAGRVAGGVLEAGKAALGAFKGRKLNRQEADAPAWTGDEYEQRRSEAVEGLADLMGEHMKAQADAQAPRYAPLGEKAKNIPGHMRELGRQVADLASTWTGTDAKPTAGKFDRMRYDLNRMAAKMHAAYGENAPKVLADLQGMAEPKAKPLFAHLSEELAAVSGPRGANRTMENQQQAYEAVLKGIDQGKQADLLREGVDLRNPRVRQQMVRMVEGAAAGQLTPKQRAELSDLLGPNNLQRVIQSFAPRTAEQDSIESAYESGGKSNLSTDADGNVITSDEAQDEDEGSTDFEKRQGQKLVDQRTGGAMYSFQGLDPRTDRSVSGKQTDLLNFRGGWRPRLYDLRGNDEALVQKAKDGLAKHLGEDTSWTIETRSALEDMAQREGVSLQTALGPYAGRNKVTEGTSKLDPDQTAERLGVNAPFVNKILTRYRDFMRDEAKRAGGEESEQAAPFLKRANNVEMVLKDRLRQSRQGDKAVLQTTPDQREEVLKRAITYLSNFGVVVAERATNKDPEQISADQVLALAEKGKALKSASAESGADKNDLLMFESKLAKPQKNGDMGVLYVRARQLALLGKKARQEQDQDGASNNPNVQYLSDLASGLAAMVSSGHVEGMPRGFEDGKIPANLPLPYPDRNGKAMTYGRLRDAVEYNAKKRAAQYPGEQLSEFSTDPSRPDNERRVGMDQLRTEDPSGTEEIRPQDFETLYSRNDPMSPAERRQYDDRQGAVAKAAFVKELEAKNGPKWAEAFAAYEPPKKTVKNLNREPVEGQTRKDIVPSEAKTGYMEKGHDEAKGHIIENRARPGDVGKLQAPKAQLDAESDAAMRAGLVEKRAKFIKGGATETGPRITAIDAEIERIDERETRRQKAATPVMEVLNAASPADVRSRAAVEQAQSAAALKEGAAPVGKLSERPSGAAKRKLNAQATQLHNELGRMGFGATHDSPIRHEGRFDWRAHMGKGEGNAAFGAGTYLSTGDGVHSYYKKMFTAAVRQNEDGAATWTIDGIKGSSSFDDTYGFLHEATQGRLNAAQEAVLHAMLETGGSAKEAVERARNDARASLEKQSTDLQLVHGDALGRIADYLARKEQIPASLDSPVIKRMMSIERWNKNLAAMERKLADLDKIDPASVSVRAPKSPTYQVSVDIPPERLLDWNKPLSEQSKTVQLRALKAIKDNGVAPEPRIVDGDNGPTAEDIRPLDMTGEELYRALVAKLAPSGPRDLQSLKAQARASDYLQSLGILGHFYAAVNGSQGKTPNYVIYDDSKITTNFVAFSQQNPSNKISTQAEMDDARNYVAKVLGPQIKVDFKALTGYSGEWIEAQNVIEISTTPGPGTMQVAYHEALHAFFSKFVQNNPQALATMQALADDKKILARVEALLAGHPNALAQLTDGEERLAYMYQFWAAGLLDLPAKKAGFFEAIKRFFQRVLGMITDSERAVAILEAFHDGKMSDPSVAGQVIAKELNYGMLTTKAARKVDRLVSKVQEIALPTQMVLANSDSETARKLAPRFWTNPGDESHGGEGEGYINAKAAAATKYKNLLNDYIKDLTDRDLTDVVKLLQAGKALDLPSIAYAPHREAVKNIDALLKRFYRYMTEERGMQMGKINEGYFPRTWDVGALLEKQGEFVDMLKTKYDHVLADGAKTSGLTKDEVADRIFEKIVSNSLGEHILPQRSDGVLSPFFSSAMMRELNWLDSKDSEPFQSKDLIGTLTGYFHSGARAAEYTHRFGQSGEKLAADLKTIEKELKDAAKTRFQKGEFKTQDAADKWAERRMAQMHKSVGAIEGTLGSDIGSTWRNTNAWITVYQNVRLLPLTLFASVVDPLGMVARGAPMKQAYDTFLRGMREVFASWGDMLRKEPKERQADEWEKLAMAVGSVDSAMFSHFVADEYSSMYMSKKAARLNDAFFRLNGMEAWNRGVRIGATQSAVNFLERHAKLPEVHSARWLKELGLTAADLTFNQDGRLITDKNVLAAQKGIPKPQAEQEMERVHQAIRRWVQGAVLTPNAAQRPAWSSDPHYSMFFHLKQFSYSFHQTILKRAVNEMNYGNMAPMGAFMWYIPVMMASDITKGLLQGGGSLPSHMQGMSLGDHVARAIDRSGLLTVASIGIDAQQDIYSLAGPAVEQVADSFGQPIGRTIVDALPAHGVYAEALR